MSFSDTTENPPAPITDDIDQPPVSPAGPAADPTEPAADPAVSPESAETAEGELPPDDAHRVIAMRVRSAEFTDSHLLVETAAGRRRLPWNRIEFISLGIIDATVGLGDVPRSGMAKTIRKLFSSEGPEEPMVEPKSIRRDFLLDLYLAGHKGSYRIDASHFNYKPILGQVGYISVENFRRMVEIVISHCPGARVDRNLAAFACNRRDDLKPVGAIYDYEQEVWDRRRRLEEMELAGDCAQAALPQMPSPAPAVAAGSEATVPDAATISEAAVAAADEHLAAPPAGEES